MSAADFSSLRLMVAMSGVAEIFPLPVTEMVLNLQAEVQAEGIVAGTIWDSVSEVSRIVRSIFIYNYIA